jgi:electron transport complex protein RnfC
VDYYRFAKSEIWAREKEKKAADVARERHEFRLFRQEREKEERAAKMAQKAAASKPTAAMPAPDADAKKAAIQAAIERAKAKKAGIVPKNIDNLPTDTLREIREIEARRSKLKQAMEEDEKSAE